jgi:hypothetical protein
VPRTVLEHVGGFDERTTRSEDYALWLRIVSSGYAPARIPGLRAVYRLHDGQRSASVEKMARGLLGIYRSVDMDTMPTQAHRDLLSQRRHDAEQELRLVCGERRVAWALRRGRHRLGRVRQRVGLGDRWYSSPPAEIAAAFPGLV